MHTKRQLSDMRQEHDQWQGRLRFYKDEITHFCNHLGRLTGSGKARDVSGTVNVFQDKFRNEEHHIESIRNDFRKHETLIRSLDEGAIPSGKNSIGSSACFMSSEVSSTFFLTGSTRTAVEPRLYMSRSMLMTRKSRKSPSATKRSCLNDMICRY
ncbi:MAG: hypothetical protein LW707_09370 [Sphingobacteriales bacterium]|nr:hypothetical protein [Sphingobacteriales bacterium]